MKNKYKINEILDAVNIILNQKDNVTEKKEETVLRLVDEIKENKVNVDKIPQTTESIIAQAEEYLKKGGLSNVRVRCQGLTARIEIPQKELKLFFNKYNFNELVKYFSNLGFNCTSLDLEGLISGKLNR